MFCDHLNEMYIYIGVKNNEKHLLLLLKIARSIKKFSFEFSFSFKIYVSFTIFRMKISSLLIKAVEEINII